jgi:2-polyprenyl-3-methyl-5-hydroxy-6-metoxy-1,4-benzoquinol methylase
MVPVVGGIPRFVRPSSDRAEERTRRAFEIEWQRFGGEERIYGGTAAESMRLLFEEFGQPELTAQWVRGRRVLDGGCGHGRYVRGMAELGADAYGIDLGLGIDVAARRCAGLDNVALVQGSLLEPPFAPQSFDLVFSKGVVHCTPDPPGAVRRMAELVKPGGYLFVWVYPRYPKWFLVSQELIRQVTKRMPPRLLIPLCFAAAPLLGVVLQRGVGVKTHATAAGRSFDRTRLREKAQMIYDWYSPWYQSYHSPQELTEWLRQSGFIDLRSCPIPAGASGRRAAADGPPSPVPRA